MLTRARKGFTLLELIVVLVILGLLAAIAIPTYQAVIGSAEKTQAEETAKALARNIQATASLKRVAPGTVAVAAAAELTAPSGVVVNTANAGTGAAAGTVTVQANEKCATITIPTTYSAPHPVAVTEGNCA